MSENEQVKVDTEEVDETIDEPTEDTNWEERAKQLEQKLKEKGIAHRERTKALKDQLSKFEAAPKPADSKTEKTGFDYAEKAYLKTEGVVREDFDFLFEIAKDTGKDIDALLGTKYIQAELKERKEARETQSAIPSGTKRSGQASSTTAEYWKAKIEAGMATVLDIPDPKLRSEVVKLRRQTSKDTRHFTEHPVV